MHTFLVPLLALAGTSAYPIGGYQTSSENPDVTLANMSIPSFYDRAVRGVLAKRWDGSPAMGAEFQKAKNKGCTLLSQMHADDAQAGQLFEPPRESAHSDYLELSDLTDWGYFTKKTGITQPKCDMSNIKDGYGLQAVLQAKGFSADKKDWKCVKIMHGDPGSKTMPLDLQSYNAPGGRTLRYSPSHQAQYRRSPVPAEQIPGLRSSSDIAWLAWKPLHVKGVKLNHIVTWSVTNGGTARLIAAALDALADETKTTMDTDLKPYPWKEFDTDNVSGQLVLGSPNGLGIGYMLVQHKPEIGNRRTKKIEVFSADTAASGMKEPSLWWALEDSSEGEDISME
ncbi:Mitochondrial import inner membrane translocase subunit tim8 [Didymella pomorum]|uniref:Mitochondrial import inner membrane translocase subunit tim8 n=1 Tax=Didymella pomorum TaxID=749634 RepID=A0A9W9D8G7_9PLEO|nr:Mitochondrial import inner membrane translocase subunit tim8 [Didymella pomorum]